MLLTAAIALTFGTTAFAQIAQQCSTDGNLCFSLNIPDTTASSGSGDVYMQITAPTTYTWVALGQGTEMKGAQMFVLYTDASGTNVTLSPRLGVGEVMPQYNSAAEISILDGSGVSNGVMTVNFRCDSCTTWSGGSMDFTSDSGDFIYAYKSGSSLDSDSTSATITMHDSHDDFSFDFANAKGGSSANPFTSAATTTGSSGANASSTTGSSDSSATTSSSSLGSLSGNSAPFGGDYEKGRNVAIAHGVLAAVAWVILFPFGAISMRLLSFSGLVWFHAAIQIFAYLVFVAAFGLGIYLGLNTYGLNKAHPIIGIILFVLVSIQPIGGLLHHRMFKKTGGRSIWSHGHIWLGRILITLAIINGGLGLQLGKTASRGEIIAYGVIAGIVWLVYVASIVFGELKRKKSQPRGGYKQEMSDSGSAIRAEEVK